MRLWPLLLLVLAALTPTASAEGTGTIHLVVCIEYDHADGMRDMPDDECWMDTVEHAPVQAVAADGTSHTATADFDGAAIFPDVPAGTYTVSSDAAGFTIADQEVLVEAGQRTYTVLKARSIPVETDGILVDDDMEPIAGARLQFHGPLGSWNATTNAEGGFSAAVGSGYHHLSLEVPGFSRGRVPVFVDGSPIQLMALRDENAIAVTGQVVDQDGQPVPWAELDGRSEAVREHRPWSHEPEMRNGYMVVSDPYPRGDFYASADGQGGFELSLPAGRAHLTAWADGHREAWLPFEAHEGAHVVVELERLPDKDAVVTGTVVDAATGQPVDGFSIDIRNRALHEWACSMPANESDDHRHRCDIATTAGAFEGAVLPGYSILEVWAHGRCEYACTDPFVRHVETVVLEPGENTFRIELQRRPAPDAAVSGYLLDEAGDPVLHGAIQFYSDGSHGSARIDGYGSYKALLRPGWHHVSVWAPGFYEWEGMVEAIAGKEVPFDLRLTEDPQQNGSRMHGMHHRPMPFPMAPAPMGEAVPLPVNGTYTESDLAFAGDMAHDVDGFEGEEFVDMGGLNQSYDAVERTEKSLGAEAPDLSEARKGLNVPALPVAIAVLALVIVGRRW